MSAGIANFVVAQNETFNKTVTWFDVNETPVLLSDFTAKMQVRISADSDDVVLELTSADETIVLGEDGGDDQGKLFLSVDVDVISEITVGSYKYDLIMTSSTGIQTPLLAGKFKVTAGITRDEV